VAQRVRRGIALLFHDRGTRRRWVVSSTPRPHFTPGKDVVPIVKEVGWALGSVGAGGKSRPRRDSIPDRPACSSVAIPTELPDPRLWLINLIIHHSETQRVGPSCTGRYKPYTALSLWQNRILSKPKYHSNLWRYIESGVKRKYCVIGNLCWQAPHGHQVGGKPYCEELYQDLTPFFWKLLATWKHANS